MSWAMPKGSYEPTTCRSGEADAEA